MTGPYGHHVDVAGPKKRLEFATRRGQHSSEVVNVDDFPVSRRKVFWSEHARTLEQFV